MGGICLKQLNRHACYAIALLFVRGFVWEAEDEDYGKMRHDFVQGTAPVCGRHDAPDDASISLCYRSKLARLSFTKSGNGQP